MLSQSKVKSFEEAKCPRKWQAENLTNELVRYESDVMRKGSYFEYLCLGGGAGYQENVTDLPRLKSGAKSADQLRIEAQAEKFKRMFDPDSDDFIGYTITNKQLPMEKDGVSGVLDYDCTNGIEVLPSDLKLTMDLDSDWGYWSSPEGVDYIQATTYVWLYSDNVLPVDKFRYTIFDYSTKMNVAIIDVRVSDQAIENALSRYQLTRETIEEYNLLSSWPRVPTPNECRYCKLACDFKVNKVGYIYKEIVI